MAIEPVLRNYISATLVAIATALVISVIGWVLLPDDYVREVVSVVGMVVGMAIGGSILFLLRRRSIMFMPEPSLCSKLREAASLLSFFAAVPTTVSIVITLLFPESDVSDMALISAIMIFISMLVQAYFWKEVDNVGSMSFFNNVILVVSLILLNVSSLLAINHGGLVLYAVSMFPAIAAVILMYDWAWTADLGFIISLICSVVATVAIVMEDWMYLGEILSFWIPTVLLFFDRFSMKGTLLMSEGKKLY